MRIFVWIVAIFMALAGPAWAEENPDSSYHVWQLSKISGTAWIEVPGKEPMIVRKDRKLFPGQTLTTDSRTRLQLKRGKERIQVSSNTVLSLPGADSLKPGHTIIKQKRGTIHLAVNKKDFKHFAVETPYMVAAVKGTQFSVIINQEQADIRVHEGIVEVKNVLANQTAEVTAGQSVTMNVAMFKLQSTSDNAAPVPMTFIDRGEDHPKVIAERAKAKAEAEALALQKSDILGVVNGMVMALVTSVLGVFSGLFDGAAGALTSAVIVATEPVLGATHDTQAIHSWVRLLLQVGMFLAVFVGTSLYYAKRRRRIKVPVLKRTS